MEFRRVLFRSSERAQPAVTDETWSDERVKSFLQIQTRQEEAPDFHVLLKAYQGMVPETFARFIGFFNEAGRNINEPDRHGMTILDIVSRHRNSGEYAEFLKQGGARKSGA